MSWWIHRGLAPLVGLLTVVFALVCVQELIRFGVIDSYQIPYPSDMLASVPRLFAQENLGGRILLTGAETLAAGLLITVVGIPTGFLFYRNAYLGAAFEPWVAALAAIPFVLAYPLVLVLLGRSPLSIIVLGFLAGVPPVVVKTMEGFIRSRGILLSVAQSFQLTEVQILRNILIPAALPSVFTGLRLGLVFCLINVVGGEFVTNIGGIGQLITEMSERFDLPGTYAAIGFVILVSMLFFACLERTEKWLQPGQ